MHQQNINYVISQLSLLVWNLTNFVDSPETSLADWAVRPEANPQEVWGWEDGSWQGAPTVPPYQRISLHSAITNLGRKEKKEEKRGVGEKQCWISLNDQWKQPE